MRNRCLVVLLGLAVFPCSPADIVSAADGVPARAKAPVAVWEQLNRGGPADLIVLFESEDAEAEAAAMRRAKRKLFNDQEILARRAQRYRDRKRLALSALPPAAVEVRAEYSHLPMAALRLHSPRALAALLARPEVAAIYPEERLYPTLTESLPLIGQPVAASVGFTGNGTTVAVLDTGVNWNNSAFGCTAPGTPSSCKVAVAVEIATDDGSNKDGSGHGTNVAAIVTGVATGARVAALDVFDANTTTTSTWVIEGINWAINNRNTYNIVAINMSLGNGMRYAEPCISAYEVAFYEARAAGILPVVSSGNNAYTNGISSPACTLKVTSESPWVPANPPTTAAIAVGAVYDANIGGRTWTTPDPDCTDSTTAADKVTCFSNSASFLTMLAPGAWITAAGLIYGGTSQAAPHVAGAVAVLRSAWPGETLEETENRLTVEGTPITDPRNGLSFPRLSLSRSLRLPAQDLLANAAVITGESGSAFADSSGATRESGEPAHAGVPGGHSLWWRWTAPATGSYSFDTLGSGFDTLLAVYQGSGVGALSSIAANDDDGSPGGTSGLTLQAVEGQEYFVAVDGKAGASGAIVLTWSARQGEQDIPMLPPWGVAGLGLVLSWTVGFRLKRE